MKQTTSPFADPIAETLLLPLYMRACESKSEHPILCDTEAARLVSHFDFDFRRFDKAVMSRIGTAVRASYFDEIATEFVRTHTEAVVVNVGCGLDTRFQRIGGCAKAHCYSMDLPEVMRVREELLPAVENETFLSASLLETDWLERLKADHSSSPVLFLFEGVLMYFSEEDVRKVLTEIASRFPEATIVFDAGGKAMKQKRHDMLKKMEAKLKFSLDDGRTLESWGLPLKLEEQRCCMDFHRRRWGWKGRFGRFWWRHVSHFYSFFVYATAR